MQMEDNGGIVERFVGTWDKLKAYDGDATYALEHYKDIVSKISAEYGVSPIHILSMMSYESAGGRTTGKSGTAYGPMQIEGVNLDTTISAYNVITKKTDKVLMSEENLLDVETNIRVGIMMFSKYLILTNGNPYVATLYYNPGEGGGPVIMNMYAKRVGKTVSNIENDYMDVGWLYDELKYTNVDHVLGNGFYAYKLALYEDWFKGKV